MTSSNNLFGNLNTPGQDPARSTAPAAGNDGDDGNNTSANDGGAGAGTEGNEAPKVNELDMLKQRARLMGVSFSNNIGVDALRQKIQDKLDGEAAQENGPQTHAPTASTMVAAPTSSSPEAPEVPQVPAAVDPVQVSLSAPDKPVKAMTKRQQLLQEEMALIRVRITNLDPKKKDLPGEIFTVANEFIGTVRKYVPYGEATDDGYHLPMCIYKNLVERTFVSIKVRKVNGREIVETQDAREFAFDVLPQLTEVELARLAAAQAAAGA